MTRKDLIESIKVLLGYPVIDLFVQDAQINTVISIAIRKCQSKACPTATEKRTIVNGKIAIADLDLETVKNVYMESTGGGSDIYGVGINYPLATGTSNNSLLDATYLAGQRSQLESLALYDYYLDKDYLYLDNYSGTVTLEYVKKNIDFEDLDTEWRGWVETYSTAMAKVIEGRIRGKYKVTSGPFEVEADTLVSEGTSTMQDLESKLDTSMGYFTILR